MAQTARQRFAAGGPDQAAMLAFHRQELREGGLEAQVVGVGRVNPRDQRLNQPVERLAPESAPRERGQALFGVIAATAE